MDSEKLYEDIINLPHHVSKNHPQMPLEKRAAQFMPFAALAGYEENIANVISEHEKTFSKNNSESTEATEYNHSS